MNLDDKEARGVKEPEIWWDNHGYPLARIRLADLLDVIGRPVAPSVMTYLSALCDDAGMIVLDRTRLIEMLINLSSVADSSGTTITIPKADYDRLVEMWNRYAMEDWPQVAETPDIT